MKIGIRVDALARNGHGHMFRCMTLAEKLRDFGHEIGYLLATDADFRREYISPEGSSLMLIDSDTGSRRKLEELWSDEEQMADARSVLKLYDAEGGLPDCMIVDHYGLSAPWERIFVRAGMKVLVIDDLTNRPHECDLLMNPIFGRVPEDYRGLYPDGAKLLMGSDYALLRSEFVEARRNKGKVSDKVETVNVSIGSTDVNGLTVTALRALEQLGFKGRVEVILTESAANLADVQKNVEESDLDVRLMIDVPNMADSMLRADIAIGAAGSTSWERCCMGLPSIVIVLAQNQKWAALSLESAGAAIVVDNPKPDVSDLLDPLKRLMEDDGYRKAMAESASRIVDGRGAERVAKALASV